MKMAHLTGKPADDIITLDKHIDKLSDKVADLERKINAIDLVV